jgi:hypothetical protein
MALAPAPFWIVIFALQHLRIRRRWLNSMQPDNTAYFVCKDAKGSQWKDFFPAARSASGV